MHSCGGADLGTDADPNNIDKTDISADKRARIWANSVSNDSWSNYIRARSNILPDFQCTNTVPDQLACDNTDNQQSHKNTDNTKPD